MSDVKELDVTEPGYITIRRASGPPVRYPIADLLRGVDMPGDMTPDESTDMMPVLTSLANLLLIIVRTLMDRDILDEDYVDGWDIQYLIQVLVTELGAEWGE